MIAGDGPRPAGAGAGPALGRGRALDRGPDRDSVDAALPAAAGELGAAGRRPYSIPRGGATGLGAVGYALAAAELGAQLDLDDVTVVVADRIRRHPGRAGRGARAARPPVDAARLLGQPPAAGVAAAGADAGPRVPAPARRGAGRARPTSTSSTPAAPVTACPRRTAWSPPSTRWTRGTHARSGLHAPRPGPVRLAGAGPSSSGTPAAYSTRSLAATGGCLVTTMTRPPRPPRGPGRARAHRGRVRAGERRRGFLHHGMNLADIAHLLDLRRPGDPARGGPRPARAAAGDHGHPGRRIPLRPGQRRAVQLARAVLRQPGRRRRRLAARRTAAPRGGPGRLPAAPARRPDRPDRGVRRPRGRAGRRSRGTPKP